MVLLSSPCPPGFKTKNIRFECLIVFQMKECSRFNLYSMLIQWMNAKALPFATDRIRYIQNLYFFSAKYATKKRLPWRRLCRVGKYLFSIELHKCARVVSGQTVMRRILFNRALNRWQRVYKIYIFPKFELHLNNSLAAEPKHVLVRTVWRHWIIHYN